MPLIQDHCQNFVAKKRYKIEAKNSELKHPHAFKTAKSAGLFGMEIKVQQRSLR